jgi:4-hydroxy-tetrahydrodipicolinate synthase
VVSVVGHLVGPRLAELVAAVEAGDLVKARAVNDSLLPVYKGVMGGGHGAIMIKAALNLLGLPAGPMRPPLVDASPEEIARLRTALAAGGISL